MATEREEGEAEKAGRRLDYFADQCEGSGDPAKVTAWAVFQVGAEIVRALGRIEVAIRESKPPVVYGGVQVATIPLNPTSSPGCFHDWETLTGGARCRRCGVTG